MKLQKIDIKDSFQDIFSYVGEKISHSIDPVVVILESGHFSSNYGPDKSAINTLSGALCLANNLIATHKRKIRVVLALLIDDLGLACNVDICSIKNDTVKSTTRSFPDDLISILNKSPIYNPKQFIISSERAAKNRGILKLKGIIKRKSEALGTIFKLEEDNQQKKFFFCSNDGQNILLADIKDWVWSSHCPLIMGQHYFDLHKKVSKRYPYNWPQILVDFSSIYERGKVNSGAELAIQFLSLEESICPCEIVNICFADENGEVYTIDYFSTS